MTDDSTPGAPASEDKTSGQNLEDRVNNRSHRPSSGAFRAFMASNWGPRTASDLPRMGAADHLADRHARISAAFPGERLVIPAGGLQTRSNDTDYRFRAHSAFAHMTGLEAEMEPDAVLVLHPVEDMDEARADTEGGVTEREASTPLRAEHGIQAPASVLEASVPGESGEGRRAGAPASQRAATAPTAPRGHEAVLYFVPRASRTSEEFYADSRYGEFWVGARPSLAEMQAATGIRTENIDMLKDALAKDAGAIQIRVVTGADAQTEALVNEVRQQAGLPAHEGARQGDEALVEMLSEIRLTKDVYEVQQMQEAVDATKAGFENIIRSLPRAIGHPRGERIIEGAFSSVAREYGNGLGYETIAASGNHANTLHWMDNSGVVLPQDLVLVDAGVELDSLYTADITRTLPVSGVYSEPQRKVYEAVLEAAEAALERAQQPGVRFRNLHEAAQEVLARHLDEWGLLPVPVDQSLSPEGQQHRRWMPHGTCHHLGLDVHDCAQARQELYQDALLRPGMVFTIEPGLYFRADDMAVPEEFRGIGVRIEDDIVIEEDGTPRRLSEDIPRTIEGVEAWMKQVQQSQG